MIILVDLYVMMVRTRKESKEKKVVFLFDFVTLIRSSRLTSSTNRNDLKHDEDDENNFSQIAFFSSC
jgi:hypothetical protein